MSTIAPITAIVYQATNRLNGHRYIGFTTQGLEKRRGQHLKDAKSKNKVFRFHRALNKYGPENFVFEVMVDFQGDEDLAKVYEIEAIAAYKPEYNLSYGGEGGRLPEETRAKISAAHMGREGTWLGKKFSEEHRRRIGDVRRGKPNLAARGRKLDPDKVERRRQNQMGHAPTWTGPHTEETKQKLREANKGQVPWILGKHHKEESKQLMSAAKKLAHQSRTPEYTAKLQAAAASMSASNKKPIRCVTDGSEHASATDAARFYGMAPNTITAVLRGHRPAARGLVFEYREVPK